MTKNTISIQATYVHWLTNICSSAHEHMFMDKRTYVLRMVMLVMMMMGVSGVWADEGDLSGIYYIASEIDSYGNENEHYSGGTAARHCYLIPAEDESASELAYYTSDKSKPYLTTLRTNQDLNSIWILKKTGDYYNIIHALTGKYLVYAIPTQNQNGDKTRRVVHLEASPDLNDNNTKFEITLCDGGYYHFSPFALKDLPDKGNKFLNVCTQNRNITYGQNSGKQYSDGLIGVYGDPDANNKVANLSRWHLEDASTSTHLTPIINDLNEETNIFIITSPAAAFSSFRYTTDGSTTPTASVGTLTDGTSIFPTATWQVQAVGVFDNFVTPVAGPKTITPIIPVTPTINYDNSTGEVTISSTDGTTIYYTASTSGTEPGAPTSSSYDGTGSSPVTISGVTTPTIYKAIATKSGFDDSDVATQSIEKLADPSVSFVDATQKVTITKNSEVEGAQSVYTITGNDPTSDSEEYSEAISLTGTTTVKAMTVKDGYINSDVVSLTVTKLALPTISISGSTVTLSYTGDDTEVIHYTTDGTPPTLASSSYTEPFSLDGNQKYTIKAIATKTGCLHSDVSEQVVDNRTSIPAPTIEYTGNTVTITASDYGDEIYYTTDGTTPTNSTATHFTTSGTFNLDNGYSYTIKAIASNGDISSTEATETIDLTNTGYAGIYYIHSTENGGEYYMYPVGGESALVTTAKKTDQDAIWKIERVGDYYRIIHYNDGKYLVAAEEVNDVMPEFETVSLVATNSPGENALFEITCKLDCESDILQQTILIRPKAATDANTTTTQAGGHKKYLNKRGGNLQSDPIGLYDNTGSSQWTLVTVPAKPTFTVNDINVTISSDLGNVHYTIDGITDPTSSSPSGKNVTLAYGPSYTVKAISIYHDNTSGADWTSDVAISDPIHVALLNPIITRSGNNVTITNSQSSGVTFRYTFSNDGTFPADPVPDDAGTDYESALPLTANARNVFKAIAYNIVDATPYTSDVVTFIVDLRTATTISSLADITSATGSYKLASGFSATGTPKEGDVEIGTSSNPFRGTIDGNLVEFQLSSSPLFDYVQDATIKNVIISKANISTSGNAGAIANNALGATRIYNCGVLATGSEVQTDENGYTEITSCSSSITGSNYVGGIVGLLDGSSRVINCFSYANITGGNLVGGIVGKNNVATTSSNLQTMVMNCMFYGDIDNEHCTSKAPIYNGEIITNDGDADGVNNFNYFWAGASYVQNSEIDVYNCALAAETRYLQRFEFFRHLLNSNRELAAWWATGDADNKDEMMKWVMEPSQIGTAMPYPILKAPDRYPSVVNIDVNHSDTYKGRDMTVGPKVDATLSVTIQNRTIGGASAPTGANITTTSLSLNIMDKDPNHFNFNYYKVQLPYYNDVGTGNYTGNRVVTGWKIVTISGGTTVYSTDNDNNATTPADAEATISSTGDITLDKTPYNFADRKCTEKDKYSVSGRVFSQGAYFDVPEGVTSITIEPYWAKCVYVSDAYPDVVYKDKDESNTDAMYTASNVTTVGGGIRFTDGETYYITDDQNQAKQAVYTSMTSAVTALNPSGTVYDNAIVLVGNVHSLDISNKTKSKPFTIMSIDLDKDNEPDYSYILRFNSRVRVHPVRVDFLNVIGLGMAQKSSGGTGTYNFGIMQPYGWFECTNTALFRVTQLEYDYVNSKTTNSNRENSPMILHGGVIEQWVTTGGSEENHQEAKSVSYYHVGSNVWFKEFHIGVHQDKNLKTDKNPDPDQFVSPHPPISVTGGDYDEFYLTGLYNTPNNTFDDNAECYINGGRFGKVCGTGMQGIGVAGRTPSTNDTGNIIWQIDNADIDEFYAGGINATHIAEGNIYTVITNSRVDQFCGGPKFGNMNSDKKVVTNATNCIFRTFFGAGYGGNSYNRRYPSNQNNKININWNSWLTGTASYDYSYDSGYGGVETRIDYQFLPMSSNVDNVCRLFIDYVSFSLATTHDVTSKLTGCTITTSTLGRLDLFDQCLGNFYGGGSLGKVTGDVKSTLTNCIVEGNVFGGGYSATLPTVKVMNQAFQKQPHYDENLGAYLEAELPATVPYTWEQATETEFNNKQIDTGKKILYTTEDLTGLGAVTGNVTLTIDGNTTLTDGKKMSVTKSVYGGGEESNVEGNTQVNINGGTITQNVFGGGKGEADEFTCSKAMVGVNDDGKCADPGSNDNKNKGTKVTISNGTVNGNVYGGGEVGRVEWNTQVEIGVGTGDGPFAPEINGSVFGAGKGKETHGYAALVRGNSTVTIQGKAKVRKNVYGGGEQATVGRYWVKGIPTTRCPDDENETEIPTAPGNLPDEMPYKTRRGGKSTVIVQGSAQIGPDDATGVSKDAGQVFGAGKGVTPAYNNTQGNANRSKRMVDYNATKHTGEPGTTWDYYKAYTEAQIADANFKKYVWEYFVDDADPTAADYKTGEAKYLEFLQTLALVTGTDVTINGATVKGNVYGGSESGFVQDDTKVKIQAGTIGTSGTTTYGNVFGGGKGLAAFAEAGKVKGNSEVAISGGTAHGNVYGGGELGDVGTINKADINNYTWSGYDNEDTTDDTGKCKVSITNAAATVKGDVFGAGKGSGVTFQCEKAMAYNTEVTISAGTVNGNVYGGGEIGRVENNTKVKIGNGDGSATGTAAPVITKRVFGAGKGLPTHGYSALVRGNTEVTVEGNASIGISVYGGGEIASVGRYGLNAQKMPNILLEGGECKVTIQGYAVVGPQNAADDEGNVFGAGRGVDTPYDNTNKPQRMTLDGSGNSVLETINSEEAYQTFLETLALATHPEVTIGGNATVNGSVFGGGELGLTKGSVIVMVNGGTIEKDVYGGGALAHTNTTNQIGTKDDTGAWVKDADGNYVPTTVDYPTTTVRLLGGTIRGEAYGGGLGDANTPAYVYGDVLVDLNGTTTMSNGKATTNGTPLASDAKGCIVNQVFGCNNINGTPKGDVMVHVFATQNAAKDAINGTVAKESEESDKAYLQRLINVSKNGGTTVAEGVDATVISSAQTAYDNGTDAEITAAITAVTAELGKMYDVQAVYGGGNNAAYIPTTAYTESTPTGSKAQVVIEGCDYTSIQYVYGGGNAAPVPDTYVLVKGTKIIDYVFGGGNGTVSAADVGYDGNGNNQGDGNANTTLMAGTIHNVYGASNTNGDIRGKANITKVNKPTEPTVATGCCDKLVVNKMYSAGKDADISGGSKVILGCMEDDWIEEYYGGAENANVLGDVELTITSGKFRKVFGGNKTSGAIFGHIKVNIEETGCIPIYIDELYGCGNEAPYSIYGYSWDGTSTNPNNGKKIFTARTSASNGTPVKPDGSAYTNEGDDKFTAYDSPEVNIISATRIGKVFGGGLGSNAIVYGNPTVNINMIYGTPGGVAADALGEIGDVYGGGNAAAVHGNTMVNIGTETTVQLHELIKSDGTYQMSESQDVVGANITGNVFGAGKGKDDNVETALVRGNATVNMAGGTVKGNIYGGGELSSVGDFTYDANKMVTACTTTTGTTTVNISGGTIGDESEYTYDANNTISQTTGGNVFAGGKGSLRKADNSGYLPGWYKFAKVKNTVLNISGTTTRIMSNAYGGGELATVGYEAISGTTHSLVGGTSVTISGGTIGTEIQSGSGTSATTEYTFGSLYGGGFGSDVETTITGQTDNTDPYAPKFYAGRVYGSTSISMSAGAVKASVYGGGQLASVGSETSTGGNTTVTVSGGTVGINKVGDKLFGGATMGNVYGGGSGKKTIVRAGQIFGNTTVSISGTPTIYHNVYGGGAYGSVGTYEYDTEVTSGFSNVEKVTGINSCTAGGTATITITGGTIGVDGKENGMVFGSSRGDVGVPGTRDDLVAWVNNTIVTIGDANTGPQINGSVYGSGENGHTLQDARVTMHNGTVGIESGSPIANPTDAEHPYTGASYANRGNLYGGGCGTDKYYSNPDEETYDGNGQLYNSLAGIVQGDTYVTIDGGHVVHNVYGAGAMGSVGTSDVATSGKTTINISGGTIGVDGTAGEGNVFGAARGDKEYTSTIGLAQVRETSVTISSGHVMGNVYGGGEVGNVGRYTNTTPVSVGNYTWDTSNTGSGLCTVTVSGGKIGPDGVALSKNYGNVYGGGKGVANTFECEKAMVYRTSVNVSDGSIVNGTVYGGGEVGRVENNTVVVIGTENGTDEPEIKGSVFGAGAGIKTHGYSALVRGTSSATIQGKAKVLQNVYGGGEKASVGRYKVKTPANENDSDVPASLPYGMPAVLLNGGTSTVIVRDNAVIGTDNNENTGHVYGAGQGVDPYEVAYTYQSDATKPSRMVSGNTWEYFADETKYLQFIETLGLSAETDVTIDESATVKGSVFGGSESGFVYHDTEVKIQGGTINGDAFGGGRGLATFAEAGRVSGNTEITISDGAVHGNVYGGGNLGDVGTIYKADKDEHDNLTYNYVWRNRDANGNINASDDKNNIAGNNKITGTNNNTGICKVTISGGTIGIDNPTDPSKHGHVFGAGEGLANTWWCEKATAFSTDVNITKGTVKGNVYGGGQVGRVEDDAKVTIGAPNGTDNLVITGNVFGAGAGFATHGYSALVRGNADVIVQGKAQIGGSVYGGGEKASVGRFKVIGGLPTKPQSGGTCTVTVKDDAKIGASGTGHNVYGACKGVDPATITASERKSMQTVANGAIGTEGEDWDYYAGDNRFVWKYYKTEDAYLAFLKTLALTSNTEVAIDGSSSVYGSVYGGGERGVTLGGVDVNMTGGTVYQDVYGGGSLADSNTAMWDATNNKLYDYVELDLLTGLSLVTGCYTKSGDDYTLITTPNAKAESGVTYYANYKTNVSMTGGQARDLYGGGLGQVGDNPIEAKVYGEVTVKLNEGKSTDDTGAKVDRVFGANNLNGSPQGNVTVRVYATQNKAEAKEKIGNKNDKHAKNDLEEDGATTTTYDVIAVYGGGNEAAYIPQTAYTAETPTGSKTQVFIEGCDETSIKTVYGGGNAASVPESNVTILSAYEIERVFGGGNGKDDTSYGTNPGADIGVYKNASNEDVIYGTGNANTDAQGGYIHELYGASNEKGTIKGNISLKTEQKGNCTLKFDRIYNAGKNADVEGDMIAVLGCQPDEKIPEYYGGAENANVKGNVELTITSGTFGQIFAGNNKGGAIFGHIKLNVEETGCSPIIIDELYGCGNNAAYSVYGYYHAQADDSGVFKDDDNNLFSDASMTISLYTDDNNYVYWDEAHERPFFRPRTSANDTRAAVFFGDGSADDHTKAPYAHPEVNIISCTSIGKVFGGGYGVGGVMYADPTVNINMIPGAYANNMNTNTTDNPNKLGEIGTVYGGGNAADVIGDPTVNIGTEATVQCHVSVDASGNYTMGPVQNVLGAYITGNVYGGGKGEADNFFCDKAMIGKDGAGIIDADGDGEVDKDGGTTVNIFKGFVGGNVYGGGQIGRVEKNTVVTIGTGNGVEPGGTPTSAPVIMGSVYGGGAGEKEHGYAALVRGNPIVIIQGNAKVRHSVYGGGEIASVARYNVPKNEEQVQAAILEGYTDAKLGMPYALKDPNSGTCTVTIRGYAEIGPETAMQMTKEGGPDDTGYVFGAGRGILPGGDYAFVQGTTKRMVLYDAKDHASGTQGTRWQWVDPDHSETNKNVWEYFADLNEYIHFIQTLALSSRTYVTITDNAFVKGSVYGGSENGIVQFNTDVKIQSGQIGCGKDETEAHPDDYWTTNSEDPTKFAESSSWEFKEPYDSYDPYAKYKKEADGKYYYDSGYQQYAAGGAVVATDGHTYYGNVFGGGSGSMPYFDATKGQSVYLHSAGQVKGNTNVTISGGHILTNVYGGCESTNVEGTANVTMTGGTVGVPRTDEQIIAHPLTGYIFGGGKGDQRIFFNKDTNVKDAVVTVEGGRVYGSVYGGGEDGHVLRNVTLTIGKQTTTGEGDEAVTTTSGPKIGTKGTSYYDGHVFGGGRGFGGDALTAGNVGGSVDVNILDGEILGSVYGGGRLASVGYGLYLVDEEVNGVKPYGIIRPDNEYDGSYTNPSTEAAEDFFTKGRGHIAVTISGGTIGNDDEYGYNADNQLTHTKGGNVFAGGMGRMYKLDEITPISSLDWWKLGCAKSTKLTITGGIIKSNVYGGGELGQVVGAHTAKNAANADVSVGTEIIINGGTIGSEVKDGSNVVQYTFGSVFGGGYGSLEEKLTHNEGASNESVSYPKYIAGRVMAGTKVNMTAGRVWASVYGGGEMAAVGESKALGETLTTGYTGDTHVIVSGGTIGKEKVGETYFGRAKMGNVYGGGSGSNNTVRSGHVYGNTNVTISDGTIYHNVYGGGAYGTVGDFVYTTTTESGAPKVSGITGLHTDRTGTGVARVTITGGTIGVDGNENGMVFGSSRGDINEPGARDDYTAWVYDTNVIIGTSATGTEGEGDYVAESGPDIKGAVYGSGENGHTFNNTVVTVNGGTIGITSGSPIGAYTQGGATYPYRGNVYGGGCGTDTYSTTEKYDSDGDGDIDDNDNEKIINAFNPLAGIVYGTTTININGGTVARNVYGAGAMGSVGKTTWTTTSTTKSATTTGGSTTININGGTIGVSGTVGDGNVFGAARGSKDVVQTDRDDLSRVRETNVTVSNGNVKGNVYGGGELGDVGTIIKNTTNYNYTWEKSGGGANAAENNGIAENNTNTGICNVTIEGGTIGSTTAGTGNVFGGGKGDANTWWCEKAIAFATNVSISGSDTKVYGTVYGGGEIGRVEDDTKVIIGTENGSDIPDIKGNVFGAGKGMATRGYSALVRGNSIVTIQGSAKVGGNVFGGGEEASLGRFVLDKGLPKSPQSGGYSTVTIQDNAKIGSSGTGNHVYGAGQGVAPNYDEEHYKNFKSMQLYDNRGTGDQVTDWDYYVDDNGKTDNRFVWVYYKTEPEYQAFLNTLALASHPTVTIAENATIYGDVYGGGQRGITLGNVAVNITGGTVKKDVYGGGSLADTNKGNWDDSQYVPVTLSVGHTLTDLYTKTGDTYIAVASDATATSGTTYYSKGTWATGKYVGKATTYKTNVALTGGTIEGNVYGGGLGQIARAASAAQGTEGQEGYVPAVTKLDEVKAKVYGDVLVTLNKPTTSGETTTYGNCVVKENIFGCNNQNGSPQSAVTVHVYKTEGWTDHEGTSSDKLDSEEASDHSYHLNGVYGGGNLSAFYPDLKETRDTVQAFVIIDGCDQTSIKQVYGGGNAASIPATNITINASYEIEEVFGGGNGLNEIIIHGQTMTNPGANVGYEAYPTSYDIPASSKEERTAKFSYGSGKSSVTIYDGLIHRVFGGSNKKGNVRESAVTLLDDQSGCHFQVDEAYGGGKNAPMDAEAKLLMACIPGLKVAYGGAQEADVLGGVTLTITNGTYERVFGGNNISGTIQGPIVVNIEETGCRPVIIGELYGGGNRAAYSVYGYKLVDGELKPRESASDGDAIAGTPYADPVVNVKSFTSIGTIYGGGYGETAVMVGNPTVNIDVFKGKYAETYGNVDNVIGENAKVIGSTVTTNSSDAGYATGFPVPSHAKGAIGAIGTVFGGGNAAKVIGTPTVNIGTRVGEQIDLLSVPVTDSNGKTSSEAGWIPTYQKETVLGADIRGDVYGAGNNAEVTGDTKVQIGKKIETSTTPDPDPTPGP